MKVRRLQRLNQARQWEDHGYVFEREDGHCLFRFNTLVWGRIGAEYNAKLEELGATLEDVPAVIPTGHRLRWLDIEEINGDPDEIKTTLDEACKIPRPLSIAKSMLV